MECFLTYSSLYQTVTAVRPLVQLLSRCQTCLSDHKTLTNQLNLKLYTLIDTDEGVQVYVNIFNPIYSFYNAFY